MIKAVVRTDSSQQIGSGHVMRCLTLAEELRDQDLETIFITRDHQGNLDEYIMSKGFEVYSLPNPNKYDLQQNLDGYEQWLGVKQEKDAEETIQVIPDTHTQIDWLIVDHYAIDQVWEKKLRPYTKKIMVIDDLANRQHDCDLLLDQNYIQDNSRYNQLTSLGTTKLLGPKYALLRKDFIKYSKTEKQIHKELNRIFVFFGGADQDNLTTAVLKALTIPELRHLFIDVVIGSANPHQKEIKEHIDSNHRIKLYIQVDNMAEIMNNADLALGAGGSTTWERMAVGLPSIVITTAENQVPFNKELDQDNYIYWIGNIKQVSQQKIRYAVLNVLRNPQKLYEMSERVKQLVSTRGTKIVSNLLIRGLNKKTLTVRQAKLSDCKLYWYWINDNLAIENSINQEKIDMEYHNKWFNDKVKDENTILLVIESEFGAVGQVRFDRSGSHYKVNYSYSSQFRGYGLANHMISIAIDYARLKNIFVIEDYVKDSNATSKKVFEQLPICTNNKEQNTQLSIVILSDRETWMNTWIGELLASWVIDGYTVSWTHEAQDVPDGDLCFILSYGKLVKENIRSRNKNNLVVHASDLPKGKGWSPLSWQILEGKNKIVVTLFEAEDAVDSGDVYLQDDINLNGNELVAELRKKQAEVTLNLCRDFVRRYPSILQKARQQYGVHTFYAKRTSVDSQLDPNKTIAEQFNLLRIVDNNKYPAYFDWKGQSYTLKIEKL